MITVEELKMATLEVRPSVRMGCFTLIPPVPLIYKKTELQCSQKKLMRAESTRTLPTSWGTVTGGSWRSFICPKKWRRRNAENVKDRHTVGLFYTLLGDRVSK